VVFLSPSWKILGNIPYGHEAFLQNPFKLMIHNQHNIQCYTTYIIKFIVKQPNYHGILLLLLLLLLLLYARGYTSSFIQLTRCCEAQVKMVMRTGHSSVSTVTGYVRTGRPRFNSRQEQGHLSSATSPDRF
jgi:hypothetical protein